MKTVKISLWLVFWALAFAAVAFGQMGGGGGGQTGPTPSGDTGAMRITPHNDGTVDLYLKDVRVSEVVQALKDAELLNNISFGQSGDPQVTLTVKNVSPEEAVRLVCNKAGMVFEKNGSFYYLRLPEIWETLPGLKKTVNVDVINASIRDTLLKLGESAGVLMNLDSSISPAMKVTAVLKGVDLMFVLNQICSPAKLEWRVQGERLVITPMPKVTITGPDGEVVHNIGSSRFAGFGGGGGVGGFGGGRGGGGGGFGGGFGEGGGGGGISQGSRGGRPPATRLPGAADISTQNLPGSISGEGSAPAASSANCAKCGKALEAGWQFCPYCGASTGQAQADWKYCPFCGRTVAPEAKAQPKPAPTASRKVRGK